MYVYMCLCCILLVTALFSHVYIFNMYVYKCLCCIHFLNTYYSHLLPQVTDNPAMAADGRNQGLVGMADGIPMFRDKDSRGVTPIALRTANLPDHLSVKFRHIHLSALYPHDFWRLSEEGSKWERAPRKPKSLSPLLHVLADDLLFWEDGQTTEDHSKPVNDPDRIFTLRAILLFWCGDYPGLGETTSFAHCGHNACHWCKVKGI
jgi:hypothetical protein